MVEPNGDDRSPLPPPRPGIVDRCVCMQMAFSHWLAFKTERGLSMDDMAEATGCGCGCGSCAPYLGVVAVTRKTELPIMSYAEMLRVGQAAK